nr:ADP-ribosylation factor 1-like [Ipomoea batatas]
MVDIVPDASVRKAMNDINAAIGFSVETVQYNNIKFQVWDLGAASHLDFGSFGID